MLQRFTGNATALVFTGDFGADGMEVWLRGRTLRRG